MIASERFSIAEFAYASTLDAAAELSRHRLHAIADAEHRRAQRPGGLRCSGSVAFRNAARSAGKDDAARRECADEIVADVVRVDLAVDVQLSKPAGDQLRVLRTEVEDQNPAMRS